MTQAHHSEKASIKSILSLWLISTTFSLALPAQAQITPDNTLSSEASRLNQNLIIHGALGDKIDGGATRGSNLFHSFSEFNIQDGQRVYFANPTGVENILTRVTGGNRSNIFGTLGVDGAANLFLINPNGILFGQNARLDVEGSFIGTTANGVQFGNQGLFSATNPKAPPLLTVNPSALFFNQLNQNAGIQNNSVAAAGTDPAGFNASGLRVADGKSLLLVGGNVSMDGGKLNAYGGRVELGGLAAPGNVNLLFNGDNLSLKFPQNVTRASVSLTNKAGVDVEATGGGDIAINARNIDILGGSLLSAGIAKGLGQPEATAGDITLNATGDIKVADSGSKIRNLVNEDSKGNGGNITIDSRDFSLRDGAKVEGLTYGQGNAGNVTVMAKNAVDLANAYILSVVEAGGVGKGGNIGINATKLSLTDGAQLLTATREASATQPAGRGDVGDVSVKVTGAVDIVGEKNGFLSAIFSSVNTGTVGNGGNITIDSGDFSLRDGAHLEASTYGRGNAGNVTVIAKDAVSLVGGDIFNNVERGGVGNTGGINIRGSSLSLTDGAQLQSGIRGADSNQVAGKGNGGSVDINVTGAVTISGTKDELTSGIFTNVETGARGNGGNINISSGSFFLTDGAKLVADTAGQGLDSPNSQAGNITVNTTRKVEVAGVDSGIYSSLLTGGVGNGGNITIDSGDFSLRDGALLNTSTFGQGNAGNVTVRAKNAVSLANSNIFSTVEAGGVGKGGNIDINATTLSLTDGAQLLTITSGASATQPEGQGNAGNVNVLVTGAVDIAGEKNGFPSAIFSSVDTGTVGNGGNIFIDSGDFSLRDGALLSASTYGRGNAGNVTVGAKNAVDLANGNIFSTVEAGGVGKGGNIDINATTLSLTDGAQLAASTSGMGNAGNVTVRAKDDISLGGQPTAIFSAVEAGGIGKGGNININATTLSLTDGAQLLTATRGASATQPAGQGDAGNVNVFVTGAVDIAGEKNGFPSGIRSFVGTGSVGNGGNIFIDSGDFSLRDGALLSASTFGQGNAGNVTVRAKNAVSLANSNIFSTVEAGGVGKGGNIDINATTLSLTDAAQLLTATRATSATQPAGQGDAGNVNVLVTGAVDIAGEKNGFPSAIFSSVDTGTVGNGGNIFIDSGDFSLRDGALLNASTSGVGNAGNVTVGAKNAVDLANSNIFSTVEAGGVGKGGNIDVNATTLSLTDGAQLVTITRRASATQPAGQGNAGNVNVKVTGAVDIAGDKNGFPSGIRSLMDTGTVGNGGNIFIDSGLFSLRNGAQLVASTYGQGNAGNVNLKVTGTVDIGGEKNDFLSLIRSLVGTGTVGNGGNIFIDSGSFSLSDGAQLSASTFGQGNAGNVTVGAKNAVSLANSNIFSTVEAGGVGKGGNIDINATKLSLTDAAQLLTATRGASATQPAGQGNAGNVNVLVTGAVDIFGQKNGFPSAIFSLVDTGTVGNGGNIFIDSGSFSLRDGDQLSASTFGQGNAGNIRINAKDAVTVSGTTQQSKFSSALFTFTNSTSTGKGGDITVNTNIFRVSDGALLDARTRNNQKGGDITVNANVFQALNGGQLTTTTSSNGRAGKITVNANDKLIISGIDPSYSDRITNFPDNVLNIGANSGLFVSSTGSGITGDIEINSPKITLDNQGKLNAESASGNGGNINVNSDLLLLRHGAQISTNAGTAEKGGDGGNININSRFIIAVPKENSDISANAFTGTGGNIQINSQGIFGIEARPKPTEKSDITASSQLGVLGVTNINAPDNSFIQNSFIELSPNVIDTNALIANSCILRGIKRQENSFIVTGSGALPNNRPGVMVSTYTTGEVRGVKTTSRPWKKGDPIIEPQGVYRLTNGQLILSRGC